METRISYIKKNYARRGVLSAILAVIAVAFLGIGISMAYRTNGDSGLTAAVLGLCALLVAITGLFYGCIAFLEEDCNLVFAKIGIGVCSLIIIGEIILMIIGGL